MTSAVANSEDALAKGDLSVKFWGVRGSIACSGEEYVRYGGNTSCLEVRYGDQGLAILDAGTGLRALGRTLCEEGLHDADIFLTHTHMDHIAGIPFFQPFFRQGNSFRLHAGHLLPEQTLEEVVCHFMKAPLFPVPPSVFNARLEFRDFRAGETLRANGGLILKTAPLNHPNGATGYRLEYGGKAICFITDTEHREGELDRSVLDLVSGADIMIYDCSYTDEEYPRYRNWGHSTWQEGVRICEAADVGRLVIFHHDPSHDDGFMDRIAEEAERARPGTLVAREGLVLDP